jgi:UDP-N-acetylglucosamine 2-epimerase (non-hydrolysing)
MAEQLLAPTDSARTNLLTERLGGSIHVTGNTVIDALRITDDKLRENKQLCARIDVGLPFVLPGKKLLLVTGHRRENFGAGFEQICAALRLLSTFRDTHIIYPVHLNPNVQKPVNDILGGNQNIDLIAPLDYLSFVRLMQRADCILTDSGGIQEEAPYLGKPVLVMREVTERPEALAAGAVRLVGTDTRRIVDAVRTVFDSGAAWRCCSPTLYGDGYAAERIVAALRGEPVDDFVPGAVRVPEVSAA